MPRFVVLEHSHPAGVHWDMMFERGPVLATWSLPLPPSPNQEAEAESLPDHRLDYLDYEGPVSGDRGSVKRWDAGTYRIVRQTESQWVVVLSGERLIGQVELDRLPDRPDRWRVRFALET